MGPLTFPRLSKEPFVSECPELGESFSIESPFDKIGAPVCNMELDFTMYMPRQDQPDDRRGKKGSKFQERPADEEEGRDGENNRCALTVESSEASEITLECLDKLAQRTDLTKVVFIVHGFQENSGVEWMQEMQRLLNSVDKQAAVVRVGWGPQVPDYRQGAGDTRYVGSAIGLLVKTIRSVLGDNVYTHCIGFSLGAQVCGFAGHHVASNTPKKLDRISGLDPAGEFYYPDNPNSPDAFADGEPSDANDARLDASDATFVDVYHTDGFTNSGNAIVSSTMTPIGTVDVYPGSQGVYGGDQPGCEWCQTWWMPGTCQLCAHFRVPEIYINSLVAKLNPSTNTCKATAKCVSLPPPAECSGESSGLELGYFLSEEASGSYTLDTVASFPFCG